MSRKLTLDSKKLDILKDISLPPSIFGTAAFLQKKSGELKKALAVVADNMGGIVPSSF